MLSKVGEWYLGVDQGSRVHLGLRNEVCGMLWYRVWGSHRHGWKRVSDLAPSCPPQTTLECTLRPGLVYNKVNPIFHHWSLGDCKFGLTFQSPAEADEFQKSLLAALAALGRGEWCRWWALVVGGGGGGAGVEGWEKLGPGNSLSAFLPAPGSLTPSSSSSSSSSPSQDTADTPCPLTVSLQDAALLGGQGFLSMLQTFLSTYCVSSAMPRAGNTNLGPNNSVNFDPSYSSFSVLS